MRHNDLVVIGAGSGNAVVDDSFADLDVAVVEERWFGGTCLNEGRIPSKMLAYTAHVARTVREAGAYDVEAELKAVRWRDARDRVFGRLDAERDSGRRGRKKDDSGTVYEGRARFTGPGPSGSTGWTEPWTSARGRSSSLRAVDPSPGPY
ncbi:hypothetical protein ACFWWM_43995 [Streptomyces sp. NPDC058682]|uniref:hypothetical protein n=1 Tax=Streptomyces sp. NPDC058682 TaxID=3346596 RepID=UPI003667A39B